MLAGAFLKKAEGLRERYGPLACIIRGLLKYDYRSMGLPRAGRLHSNSRDLGRTSQKPCTNLFTASLDALHIRACPNQLF